MSSRKRVMQELSLTVILVLILTACGSRSTYSDSYDSMQADYNYSDMLGVTADMAATSRSFGLFNGASSAKSMNSALAGSESYYVEDYDYVESSPEMQSSSMDETSSNSNTVTDSLKEEKLVYRGNISMEVKTFDEALSSVKELILASNGLIENQNIYDNTPWEYYIDTNYYRSGYKTYSATIRIPSSNFDSFMNSIGDIGHVTSTSTSIENISQRYYDTKATLESYENQLKVLQDMYSKAETIADMLEIEARISEVSAEINKLKTDIQWMDRDVAYSTVTLSIKEVREYNNTPREIHEKNFFEKLCESFINGWENFVEFIQDVIIWFAGNIFDLLVLIGIVWLVIKFIKRKIQDMKARREGKPVIKSKIGFITRIKNILNKKQMNEQAVDVQDTKD